VLSCAEWLGMAIGHPAFNSKGLPCGIFFIGIYPLTMGTFTMKIQGYRCERCGHSWTPRNKTRPPKVCPNPKCKSPYWDRPRQTPVSKKRVKAANRNG